MNQANQSHTAPAASADVRDEENTATVVIKGDWTLRTANRPDYKDVLARLEQAKNLKSVRFDTAELGVWDSSLLVLIVEIDGWCERQRVGCDLSSLPANVSGLIALSKEVPERKAGQSAATTGNFFYRLGVFSIQKSQSFFAAAEFVGQCVLSFRRILTGSAKVDWRLFWLTMQECSAQALPIVGLISFLTGLILAFVGANQLRQFGAGIFVANLVAVAMAQEMGAIMTGVIMAGRTGAAFAAQIGSMKVSEEIDALETLAISPMDFLVTPRALALLLMMPLLCLYSDLIGIAGGAVVGIAMLHITLVQYWNQTLTSMGITDIAIGFFKSAIFGVIVALTGCQRGIRCGSNAAAVGSAATSAVVLAITWIVATDAILDVLIRVLNL